jgi:phosphoribosyl 1,2-cyclic phosphodiesterase
MAIADPVCPTSMPATAPRLRFWGVRGSVAVPGPGTVIYGGNTPCIEVVMPEAAARTTLIVDAGTGIVPLGASRDWQAGQRVDLLLTHLHHDHIIGLPFFKALFASGLELHVWTGNLGDRCASAELARMFAPPLFPLTLDAFPATVTFHGFHAGETLDVAGITVPTIALNHPSGSTGYRFATPAGSAAIITDIEHAEAGICPNVTAFCRNADTVVYDMMLEACEYGRCKGWGHSTAEAAVALMRQSGARRLVGFHHSPWHDDGVMQRRDDELRHLWPDSLMAREGMTVTCGQEPATITDTAGRTMAGSRGRDVEAV